MNKQRQSLGALGGEAWQSGGDIWRVLIHRADGHLVVLSDEVVCEYENQEAFDVARTLLSIHFVLNNIG